MADVQVVQNAWECRDKEDVARDEYNKPLRKKVKDLELELLQLKKVMRQNGIPWSGISAAYLNQEQDKRKTRSTKGLGNPHLPTEVILKILAFAIKSDSPIIDPLSPTSEANLSHAEKARGNQIAINFLATCKALHEEGTKLLWEGNSFVFTTPQAVRNFAQLHIDYRGKLSHVTFRVIARYYDDNPRRQRKIERSYHRDLKGDVRIPIQQRPKEVPLVRGGFRSYTWNQIVDFLTGLRAPHNPSAKVCKRAPKTKLLPALTSLRLDLVNFSESFLTFTGPEFHDVTSHEFGCTLNELQITGMPRDESGSRVSAELSGLLKDEGLYLGADACFIAPVKSPLQALSGRAWRARVVRALNEPESDLDSDWDLDPDTIFSRGHTKIGIMDPVPPEPGKHPESFYPEERVIWKKVPAGRDFNERDWAVFWRNTGLEIDMYDECDICGSPMCDCDMDSLDDDDEDSMMVD